MKNVKLKKRNVTLTYNVEAVTLEEAADKAVNEYSVQTSTHYRWKRTQFSAAKNLFVYINTSAQDDVLAVTVYD